MHPLRKRTYHCQDFPPIFCESKRPNDSSHLDLTKSNYRLKLVLLYLNVSVNSSILSGIPTRISCSEKVLQCPGGRYNGVNSSEHTDAEMQQLC
ncbi:hypothetical protein RRG08_018055 [Elysia crispata]|uniref:Uncharacterized protein n=1 Tax=Elysia crispata TaxID=231223 RepID=A0AAE0ZD06_9GAST|nr:hypothetical protein RRG08_018055 [Elysia crispata]